MYYTFPDETQLGKTDNILARRIQKYSNGLEK